MTQQEKVMHNAFLNNGVDFKAYAENVQLEVWVTSALVKLEDDIHTALDDAGLYSNRLKQDSKAILKKLEARDSSNFKLVNDSKVDILDDDVTFIYKVLKGCVTRFNTQKDRKMLLKMIETF